MILTSYLNLNYTIKLKCNSPAFWQTYSGFSYNIPVSYNKYNNTKNYSITTKLSSISEIDSCSETFGDMTVEERSIILHRSPI